MPATEPRGPDPAPLRAVKLVHTVVWAFFAGCILAIPVAAFARRFTTAFLLIGIVLIEVVVLLANRWRCPLTDVARRYSAETRDNFDIYLPEWLARHNKTIFGTLLVAGMIFTALRRMGWPG